MNSKVAILLPVYNACTTIVETINSILNQSYSDYQLIIQDDYSTDGTYEILAEFASKEPRIRLSRNLENLGIIPTRNLLFSFVTTPYVALMDADDLMHPDRIYKQVAFLEQHSDISILGTSYQTFGEYESQYILPAKHEEIISCMSLYNVLCNPSIMLRREVIKTDIGRCDIAFRGAADFELWVRLSKCFRIANLTDILHLYRVHAQQESSANNKRQKAAHLRVIERELKEKDIEYHAELIEHLIWPNKQPISLIELKDIGRYVKRIISSPSFLACYPQASFIWDRRLRAVCQRNGMRGLWSYITVSGGSRLIQGRNFGWDFIKACCKHNNTVEM